MSEQSKASKPLSFEKALKKLEGLVDKMESSELPLEKMMDAYEEGRALLAQCKETLSEAKMRVEHIDAKYNAQG